LRKHHTPPSKQLLIVCMELSIFIKSPLAEPNDLSANKDQVQVLFRLTIARPGKDLQD